MKGCWLRHLGSRGGFTRIELLIVMVILAILAGSVIISVGGVIGRGQQMPECMISTTLEPDGTKGHNFFRACWDLGNKTPAEVAGLDYLRNSIKNEIENNFGARVRIDRITIDKEPRLDCFVLETTVDFKNPNEIEGLLAIVYGQVYGRGDMSIQAHGPYNTEFTKAWVVTITINPSHVPSIGNFTWNVNMPGSITNVDVETSDANISYSLSDSNTIDVIFEPEDLLTTVSIRSEESNFSETVIWPWIVGIIASVSVSVIIALFAFGKTFLRILIGRRVR